MLLLRLTLAILLNGMLQPCRNVYSVPRRGPAGRFLIGEAVLALCLSFSTIL
jgi:hypothetical protein